MQQLNPDQYDWDYNEGLVGMEAEKHFLLRRKLRWTASKLVTEERSS